ncbi:TetR/AcrR family transcriptional regulator [Pedobacter sp. L105]|uniref:TetR/AcrR family transcriptional regulator n=1 Tax=Pedobacter sp. L105 TaxID=1641871 RepID=UPI00131E1F49|nr:TetR/AcrR family transcriptional regulator [Pedobacter sp. L105]
MTENTATKEDLIQEQILQAAKQLFLMYGLAKVTMDDVAKAIGKGRSSLYYYYKSKDEILDAVVNLELKAIRATMAKAVDQATTTEEKINIFFVSKLKLVREKGPFFDALESGMDADAISSFNEAKLVIHQGTIKWEGTLLNKILTDGIANGELKAIEKNDLDIRIFVMLSTLHGLKREMRMEKNVRDIEPVIDQLTQMVMHGLYK